MFSGRAIYVIGSLYLLVLIALNLASTSFIVYLAVQIGSGHRL
jgi:hypothetical protein